MFKFAATAALAISCIAVPASAVTYDAFATFNGTQGAGNFTYGSVDDAITAGTLFTANTNCFIASSTCLQAAPNFDVPGATKSTVASFQYNSVNVPTDRLLLHPGPLSSNGGVFITFTAPTSGFYTLNSTLSIQDIHPTGIDVIFRYQSGANPAQFFGGSSLTAPGQSYSYTNSGFLTVGDVVSVVINRAGNYGSDSTGVNFSLSTVPEPANWALLIAGFGLTGAALRRRRPAALAA